MTIRLIGLQANGQVERAFIETHRPSYRGGQFELPLSSNIVAIGFGFAKFLVVLLATKNAQKRTRMNKLVALGIGRKRKSAIERYARVTTIDVPDEADLAPDADHPPTGRHVAPHLRRGHIRRQHYGPDRAFVKNVWIEPTFVNADESFVSTRQAYNLKLGGLTAKSQGSRRNEHV